MIPWTLLARAQTPGNGVELCLYQRDTEFSIKADNDELMNSHVHGSEDALAKLACQKIRNHPRARVLIGGLGMGYTLRSALNGLGANAQVVVAELVPAVVHWNRRFLAHLADSPLDDNRVTIHESNVAEMIKTAKGGYNAILLDVDNGPDAFCREGNEKLYRRQGLNKARTALRSSTRTPPPGTSSWCSLTRMVPRLVTMVATFMRTPLPASAGSRQGPLGTAQERSTPPHSKRKS